MAKPFLAAALNAAVNLKPDPNALPGMATAQKIVDGGAAFLLIALLGGFLMGLGEAAWGRSHRNPGASDAGKRKALLCVVCGFAVGAAATILNFAVQAGGTVK